MQRWFLIGFEVAGLHYRVCVDNSHLAFFQTAYKILLKKKELRNKRTHIKAVKTQVLIMVMRDRG